MTEGRSVTEALKKMKVTLRRNVCDDLAACRGCLNVLGEGDDMQRDLARGEAVERVVIEAGLPLLRQVAPVSLAIVTGDDRAKLVPERVVAQDLGGEHL